MRILLILLIILGSCSKKTEPKFQKINCDLKYNYVDSLGKKIGLQDGDIITKVNDKEVKNALRIPGEVILNDAKTLTISRNGAEQQIVVPTDFVKALNSSKGQQFVGIRMPFFVEGFAKLSTAEHAGIKKGDQIIGVDSIATPFYNDYQNAIKGQFAKKVQIKVLRNNDTLSIPVELNNDGKIGVGSSADLEKMGFKIEEKKYTFLEAIPAGYNECWNSLDKYISGIKQLFNGKANPNESLGSVISIGSIYSKVWDWQSFWKLTALFSIILAFMNILPIPALDGGHALFCIIEIISGRKPSDKFMEYAQTVGMFLLLGLMVYALGLDFWRLFK